MFEHSPFASVIFTLTLIIGSIGAHRLAITQEQERVYTNNTCFVSTIIGETLPYDCNCDKCCPSTCYTEHFALQ